MNLKNLLTGLGCALFFSFVLLLGIFDSLGDQVYNFFLNFRPDRELSPDVVFLDVDDAAIAYNGVFPWPRSVNADGLLRLKEFGARAAIFDIEFIDKGPQGVDTIYLNQGLSADFRQSFSGINQSLADMVSALRAGRISLADIDDYAAELSDYVNSEENNLFTKAQGIARDNDQYLIDASALYGKSWTTLNLRKEPLQGEQADRRPLAEEHFAYPVNAAPNTNRGINVDVLPPIPGFLLAAKGAGFTNVEIDPDGIRRRIFLAQNINNHWYLQLAFAPLIDYLGNPPIELNNNRLTIRGAKMPDNTVRDIVIPLDGQAKMLLDWPKKKYVDSYTHISFTEFSLLEDFEASLEKYARALSDVDINFFVQFDDSLMRIPIIIGDLAQTYDSIQSYKALALDNSSDEYFGKYLDSREQSRSLIKELLDLEPAAKINAMLPDLTETFPESAAAINDEAGYITDLTNVLGEYLDEYNSQRTMIENKVRDKFCILGRVDTGTTDIGANPFDPEYVNVGTHGVILDMILSQSFITPVAPYWEILFTIVFMALFFIVSVKLPPIPRAVTGLAVTAAIVAGTILLFRYSGIFINPIMPVFTMITAVILREIISYAGSEREKEFIRKAFSTYVSDDVVKEIIADPSRLQLGGTMRHMSALFTDLQGFSGIAEKLDAEQLVSLLNRYLTEMSDVILEEKGTIDKYEGDAIIAFFGAPVDLSDHALRACTSAIHMKRIEQTLNAKLLEEKLTPAPLHTRIGINTGSMVAGNMGTGNKMNYTIMGNAVNVSARLEGVNKQYNTWILANEDTIAETNGKILTRRLDRIRVIGVKEPIRIYELINIAGEADEQEKKLVKIFGEALDYYEKRNWRAAAQGFRETHAIEKGGPSAIFFERCRLYAKTPPPDNWDGVHNLTEK
ncbi:MAG: adenylate/guanylate cyclase domain-containing protein [Treponema sp.]|nr:adenylate/guanylate cyclase domain-containing protein [Treponema sp.]